MGMKKARKFLAVLLVLVTGVGVVACGSDSDSGGDSGNSGLEGVTWQVMNLVSGGGATSLPKGVRPPTLELGDGQARVFAGCNSGTGKAEISESTIDFGPIPMTMKSCGAVANQIEFLVTKTLQGTVKWEVNADGNLIIENGADSLVYTPQ